jgi:hypothetical protein
MIAVHFSSACTAIIKIPAMSPELIVVVSEPICPNPSWPKAAKKSCAIGP